MYKVISLNTSQSDSQTESDSEPIQARQSHNVRVSKIGVIVGGVGFCAAIPISGAIGSGIAYVIPPFGIQSTLVYLFVAAGLGLLTQCILGPLAGITGYAIGGSISDSTNTEQSRGEIADQLRGEIGYSTI